MAETFEIEEIEADLNSTDDIFYEVEDEEENLFVDVKPIKRQSKKTTSVIEDEAVTDEEPSSSTLLKKVRKISNVKRKKAESDIW